MATYYLLSMILFFNYFISVYTIPNFKFLAYPILEILYPWAYYPLSRPEIFKKAQPGRVKKTSANVFHTLSGRIYA